MITNNHGLLVNDGTLVGYLFNFQGHGIFSPDGKVEVTAEQVDTHNRLLADAEIKGLDDNCQVGQRGTFYYVKGQVTTFTGNVVASPSLVRVNGKSITFQRGTRLFRGTLQKDADCFNFKRIK